MNFRHKYDRKCAELDELKNRWDRGDKSDGLASEINGLLSQLEAMEAVGSRSNGRQIMQADGPAGGGYGRRESASGPFKTLGQQLKSVIMAGSHGQETDPRLFEIRAASGLSEGVPSSGGFLLQNSFQDDLLMATFDESQIAKMCRKIPITIGNSVKIPGLDETSRVAGSRQGGIVTYFADEATAATASKPTFRQVELNLHKLIGLTYLTSELMEDVPMLQEWIMQAFAREFSYRIDHEIINGLGSGSPLGILNSPSLVTVSEEAAQATTTFVAENAIKMYSRLLSSAKRDAVWLISSDVLPQLMTMSLTVSSGGSSIFLPPGGASAAPYATLFGKKIIEVEQCPTLGILGDVILANFRQGYLLAEKGGLKSEYSIHVKFLEDEGVLKFTYRLDGQPLLNSAITPANSGSTQSHFVVCETRDGQ